MTQERFLQILQAYGADPARWPETERAAAERHAAAHPDMAGPALQAAARLDAALGPAGIAPSPLLERRLLKRLARTGAQSGGMPAWSLPVAAAAALVVGVMVGFAGGAVTGSADTSDELYAQAFGGLEEDWVDWLGEDA